MMHGFNIMGLPAALTKTRLMPMNQSVGSMDMTAAVMAASGQLGGAGASGVQNAQILSGASAGIARSSIEALSSMEEDHDMI